MHRMLRKMDRRAKRNGFVREPNETLLHFAERIEQGGGDEWRSPVASWYRAYTHTRFGPVHDAVAVERLQQSLREVEGR